MSTTVTYNGSTIAQVNNETKTLLTNGKWLTGNIVLTDTSESGGGVIRETIVPTTTVNATAGDWMRLTNGNTPSLIDGEYYSYFINGVEYVATATTEGSVIYLSDITWDWNDEDAYAIGFDTTYGGIWFNSKMAGTYTVKVDKLTLSGGGGLETVTIFPSQTVTATDADTSGYVIYLDSITENLIDDTNYIVTLDGTPYLCFANAINGSIYAGDIEIVGSNPANSIYPFAIGSMEPTDNAVSNSVSFWSQGGYDTPTVKYKVHSQSIPITQLGAFYFGGICTGEELTANSAITLRLFDSEDNLLHSSGARTLTSTWAKSGINLNSYPTVDHIIIDFNTNTASVYVTPETFVSSYKVYAGPTSIDSYDDFYRTQWMIGDNSPHAVKIERVVSMSGGGSSVTWETMVDQNVTIESSSPNYFIIDNYTTPFNADETYRVTWGSGGTEYICQTIATSASQVYDDYFIGNKVYAGDTDTGEPFLIYRDSATRLLCATNQSAGQLHVKIERQTTTSATLITKSITANGTYNASSDNVDGYSSVTVNVTNQDYEDALTAFGVQSNLASGITALTTYANEITGESDTNLSDAVRSLADGYGSYTLEDIIARRAPAGSVVWTRNPYPYEFYQNTVVTAVAYTAATEIGASAFEGCTALTSVDMSNVTKINAKAFYGCTALTAVSFKKAVLNSSNYSNVWARCTNLKSAVITSATLLAQYLFDGCSALEVVDAKGGNSTTAYAFRNCAKLKTLILRNTTAGALASINAFNGTPFASNGSGGTLYVPSSVLSNYQSAANWSTILGYSNNRILSIEGSIYETQYADGTPIS